MFAALRSVLLWQTALFLAALLAILVSFFFSGAINTRGLLSGRNRQRELYLSPERVQLLLFTLAVAVQYVSLVLRSHPPALPDVPRAWLAVLGGSHGVYLGGKMWNTLGANRQSGSRRKQEHAK